jgi:hypothetical protein
MTRVTTSGIPQSLSGKCGGFQRSIMNFLGIVRFVPAAPTFHGSIYSILTFSLASMSFFFFFFSIYLNFKIWHIRISNPHFNLFSFIFYHCFFIVFLFEMVYKTFFNNFVVF